MTIEQMREEIAKECKKRTLPNGKCGCCELENIRNSDKSCWAAASDEQIEENYKLMFPKAEPTIKDSGNRRVFDTGAVRDMAEGKGRCDLMPLDVISEWYKINYNTEVSDTLNCIYAFQNTGEIEHLYNALTQFVDSSNIPDTSTVLLELAKHFEEGAKKYGENNWQKGLPISCYIDSAIRHYLKWLRCDDDEPHDRAFVWNIVCCIWTVKHKEAKE